MPRRQQYEISRGSDSGDPGGRLVEYYQPLKVYLFGSTARGEGGPDSDLDFCVVEFAHLIWPTLIV